MFKALVSLKHVRINHNSQIILKDINLEIVKGRHYAVTGKSGSGKTTLLNAIAGLQSINNGTISYNFENNSSSNKIAFIDARHHFKNRANTTDLYYQQRFNSSDAEDSPTVADHLWGIADGNTPGYWTVEKVVDRLAIKSICDKELIKLSNGETKRLRLASALLKNPELLLLDQPLTGLDAAARQSFNLLLQELSASGTTIIMATSPKEIPAIINDVIVLDRGEVQYITMPGHIKERKPGKEDIIVNTADLAMLVNSKKAINYTDFIKLTNTNVQYGDKVVLKNINWEIKQGQRWALLGHNGAGKSTLLSLIYGDNPQAYANNIVLFDRKRGTGESIWDIKKKCGFVSPELFQYFPLDNSCPQVIESGFYDTLGLFRPSEPSRAALALKWMQVLAIDKYRHQNLKNIPASAQRLCLLARALVKSPDLLILDEPCQGLDEEQKTLFKNIVDAICRQSNLTLIYVTHYTDELPDMVNKHIILQDGEVVDRSA